MNQDRVIQEPEEKRATAFFDGQNLYHHAKAAFGHRSANYNPKKLLDAICKEKAWKPHGVRFYTGVPSANRNPKLHRFWNRKLLAMSREGVHVTSPPLRYHQEKIRLSNGSTEEREVAREKGIDVRLALDMVRMAREEQYEVAILFSQDQDLAEVIKEVKAIARQQVRWIKLVCAFPHGPNASSKRGIDDCDWFKMDEAFYEECLDTRDYWR